MNEFEVQTSSQLASHVRSLRKSLGLTQSQLGARLGLEQARIAKIERNPGSISVEQLLALLNALDTGLFIRRKQRKPGSPAKVNVSW
jgi:HTH-type transcriptional regulator/antitoxin HipB